MKVGFVAVALLGCGRIGFAPREEPDDARSDALTDAPDDAATAPDAYPTGSFGPPLQLVSVSSSSEEDDPTMTFDGLELYFQSDRLGNRDIFRSTRASITLPWAPPTRVTELSSAAEDDSPELSLDGLTMWLGTDRPGGPGGYDIWISSRPDRSSPWSVPVPVVALSSTSFDLSCVPSASNLEVFLQSDRAGGLGDRDVYRATRATLGAAFSAPLNVTSLNTASYDGNVHLSNGDLVMVLDSDRPGGLGLRDLYIAGRTSIAVASFSTPVPLLELNTASADSDPWLSADGHVLLFSSDRSGNPEIYEARR